MGTGPDTCVTMVTEMQGWGLRRVLPPRPIVQLPEVAAIPV